MLLLLLTAACAMAQGPAAPVAEPPRPLPDIATLMREVEAHQRTAEAREKDYIFREDAKLNELDSHGGFKKTDLEAYEIFWLNGVRVARHLSKNGKDLTPDEQKKENDRIDKEVSKGRERRDKADANGKETDSHGRDELTVSRMIQLGAFTNPRREVVSGRPTIAVDYAGDPHVKTHSPAEAAFKVLSGTVWIDEEDRAVQHIQAHFFDDFKLGGGLLANIKRGTSFNLKTIRINNEVWLPDTLDAQGQARYLLFFTMNGDLHIRSSAYHKFKTSITIVPGFTQAGPEPGESPSASQAVPR